MYNNITVSKIGLQRYFLKGLIDIIAFLGKKLIFTSWLKAELFLSDYAFLIISHPCRSEQLSPGLKYLHKTNNNEKVTRGLAPPLKKVTKVTRIEMPT